MKLVLRDPSLPHQIVICCLAGSGPAVMVTCNCLGQRTVRGSGVGHDHFGPARDLPEAKRMYNEPERHKRPFREEDKLHA